MTSKGTDMTAQVQSGSTIDRSPAVENKIQQLHALFADAPEVGKKALSSMIEACSCSCVAGVYGRQSFT
jgi:hypothetical protein